MANSIILSVGDELVLGQTIDTNSAWLSAELAKIGCAVAAHMTVADAQQAIEEAIRSSAARCDWLIITGGMGPTADDLTRQALATVMGQPLELNESWLNRMEEFFRARGRDMPPLNRIQAMIPRTAGAIENTCGTAAGIHATIAGPRRCEVFIMPGVPKEMMAMFRRDVLPVISAKAGGSVILSRTLHTFGLGESAVAEMLGDLMRRDRNPSVGTTVSGGIVSLRINVHAQSQDQGRRLLEATERECRAALGDLTFGADAQTLQAVVAELLVAGRQTVATAESCTGGLLGKMLTDVPGSSAYYLRGFVTYSNEAKQSLLGVPRELIEKHGAVSEPVVELMARGARLTGGVKADVALAISGIAGPSGGTAAKPVGTVCIGLSAKDDTAVARTFHLFGDREMIRDRSAKMALTMLRYHLLRREMPF